MPLPSCGNCTGMHAHALANHRAFREGIGYHVQRIALMWCLNWSLPGHNLRPENGMEAEPITPTGNTDTTGPAAVGARPRQLTRRAYNKHVQHRYPGDYNNRTRAGRRVMKLVKIFAAALGGMLTERQLLAVHRAAVMQAMLEDTRARRVSGDTSISVEEVLRLDNAAINALRAIGLHEVEGPAPAPASQSLFDIIKEHGAS